MPRTALVQRVRDRGADVVVVTAPAGYGKSTFMAELAGADERPAAWVSLTNVENDPATLLTYIALALDEIESVDPAGVAALWTRPPLIGSPGLNRFCGMLASRARAFILVLDDVHELVDRDVLDILPTLVSELPPGSTIMLGSRSAVPLPLGRLRVRRTLVEVGFSDLAFDVAEALTMLERLEVDVGADQVSNLVERTEGWPVALHLAALAHGTRSDTASHAIDDFAGDHRFVLEYFGEELLGSVGPDVAQFLLDASCLEQLSGELCDDVFERNGSAALLDDVCRKNLLVHPVDDRREWFRFHHLMSEFLVAELTHRDPERVRTIRLRASEWCNAKGDGDGAVSYAIASGDLDRAEEMVVRWWGPVSAAARLYPTTTRWLAMFTDEQLNDRFELMIIAAWAAFAHGQPGPCVQWLARAAASLPDSHPDDARGPIGAVALAISRAIMAPLTPAEMAAEAEYGYDRVGHGQGYPGACLARGAAAFMLGDEEEARRRLREGTESTVDRPLMVALCHAHLAAVEADSGRWTEATAAARQARAMLGEADSFPSMALVIAVHAMVEAHAGHNEAADADRLLARELLTGLLGVASWMNLQARIALARAALLRGNRVEASALCDEASAILEDQPEAVGVAEQIASLRREATVRDRSHGLGPSSLTTAELRVLQLLPTHLTVAQIAERLYVSRNTIKSQMIAIYRKLGASSRSVAVDVAIEAGLIRPTPQ